MSCPTSTLPVKAVTAPDSAICSQAPPEGGGQTTISPPPSTPNQSRSPGVDRSHGLDGLASAADAGLGSVAVSSSSRIMATARCTARVIRG